MAEVVTVEVEEAAPDPLAAYADLIEKVEKPISEASPCGENVRYDEVFQELKTEIDLYGSGGGDVDFDKIVDLSRTILYEKSKDLTTAGFLIMGLLRTDEVKGLAEGVIVLDTIVETFWEHVHPLKPVRRRNAVQFVADKIKEWLEFRLQSKKPTLEDREPLELTRDTIKELQLFLMKELEDKAPALSGVLRALEDTLRRIPKPKPPPEQKQDPTATGTPGTSAAGGATASRSPAGQAVSTDFSSSKQAAQLITKATAFIREEDRKNPMPYRLLRVLRWSKILKEPPNENGKTPIPPPVPQRLAYLNGLLEKDEFEKLLIDGESDFQTSSIHFWLGLQRLIATSLEALGAPYKEAAEAVKLETALFVQRLPGIVDLTYNDGTPFVDPMALEWLQTKANKLLGGGGGGGGTSIAGSGGSDHLAAQFKEARQKLGAGDLAGALAQMQEGRGEDASQEDRFRRKLYLAVMCVRGNRPEVARALLESLDEEATTYALDAWNPGLMLEVWSNLYTCYKTLAKRTQSTNKDAFAQRADEALDKVSRVNPGYALGLLGKK